jgi:hypothetical protein
MHRVRGGDSLTNGRTHLGQFDTGRERASSDGGDTVRDYHLFQTFAPAETLVPERLESPRKFDCCDPRACIEWGERMGERSSEHNVCVVCVWGVRVCQRASVHVRGCVGAWVRG